MADDLRKLKKKNKRLKRKLHQYRTACVALQQLSVQAGEHRWAAVFEQLINEGER